MASIDRNDVRNYFRGNIIEYGVSNLHKQEVVNIHNAYRRDIENGRVPNQPRGKNIKAMSYDETLATAAKEVSKTLKMNHLKVPDNRFQTGQNLFMSFSSQKTTGPDWPQAIQSWFDEHKNFGYPNSSSGVTGHYTQVIWANSNLIGCDYVMFEDPSKPQFPYTKLYTCNYGPAGNWVGEAPYERA